MNFSHLSDTEFPNFNTANPYAIKNTFDYTRWTPNTKVHLVNVLWSSDYSNVVKFESESTRDAYFDSVSDKYTLVLNQDRRLVPDGTVKLPLPYDVAARYNYMYVEIPVATSTTDMIQYETDSGVRRWYFFIGDVSYSAPNTTIVSLQVDVWTCFMTSAIVSYMMLERGHAPVSASDTDTYLANPIGNNKYLLAPDVNFDDANVVKNSTYVPFGSGKKYICIATTVAPSDMTITKLGHVYESQYFSDPTYYDTSDWYGYQLGVSNYAFGNGKDYASMVASVGFDLNCGSGTFPTTLSVYAIPSDDSTFISDVHDKCPILLRTIQAIFMVDESMLMFGNQIEFLGHTMYTCDGTDKLVGNYTLSKDMFGFASEFERFAKLYTYPYSSLEISNNDSKTVEVRIENTGEMNIRMLTSVAYPVLNWSVFLTGINGVGSQQYSWVNLSGYNVTQVVPNGDWDKLLFEFDIPTFALYMDGETAWMLDSYSSSITQTRVNALRDYHNTVRNANLNYLNSTSSTNSAHENAVNQADTAQTNALASNDTANTNAVNSADTANTNAQNMATTIKTNTYNVATCAYDNTNLTIAANSDNTAESNAISIGVMEQKNIQAVEDTLGTNSVCRATTQTNNETSIATARTTGNASIATGILNGAQSGSMAGGGWGGEFATIGAAVGAICGGASAAISADVAVSNATTIAQSNEAVTGYATSNNTNSTNRAVTTSINVTDLENAARTYHTNTNNTCLAGQRDNNKTTTTTNADNLYNTQSGNATRTKNTDTANADRTRDTADTNTNRTHTTSVSNADRTQGTDNANTTRTREIGIINAKENLETVQDIARDEYYDSRRRNPVQLTASSGDASRMLYGLNGMQFRLRTQSDSAIAQTAAQFARFGYKLNQIWNVNESGLTLMKNFTYWKASDIWIDVRNVATSDVSNMLASMFRDGVTVWSDPDKIGKVSIYDN